MTTARYDVLDGLRGTAALLVVVLHLTNLFRHGAVLNPLHHGYLAVDFFYMLSGFVVGHAYDRRWGRMSLDGFFARRLIRLHPLVLLGAVLGAVSYLVGRVDLMGSEFWPRRFLANVVLAALCLPAPEMPGLWDMTHGLNPPGWSLTQEYGANFAYALIGPRIGRQGLVLLVGLSGAAELALGLIHGTIDTGWGWSNLWLSPVRTAFPFFAGLLLQRSGVRLNLRVGWIGLSVALLAAFAAPLFGDIGALKTNGLFEAALVMLAFPLIIAAGAASQPFGMVARLCRMSGEISYPIYIIHAPILESYAAWMWTQHPPHRLALGIGAALGLALPLISWGVLKLYDEPIRARLGRDLGERRPPGDPAVGEPARASPG
jgi:peptidoglycan/LPS O-acetylase OafA/YrhL